ncbi:heat-inducible transcriptional repressor HrcA [Tetragenococcus halophilus]|uniref:Heat-inducible transcription repressor HrcA n=1 Tax=Tetragenococcus halophilus subsp. halophilus TaxID=1513897 RepID=A0A2H6D660_TETHA|nr:heat-inducible transcriptional repressor HrcA [Tetragenococcus halophilus subsp. flandriensis]GBD67215.1 heat-inducible transcriptional repressor HrcA [Tetragenococcus halophilus subsp. halophilus]GEQ38703.1 heat-inducible transcription repressor HrcA [Tetragenococcus halophilus]GBD72724.1 heat-inducible transcriptional repressor HrcA [Tetragenococcus halophilus subsp. halophilus]GBD75396.1 heat-inducible transcriptional repressor HrcA [Tetragenococcus halophilus subsp. halophilus]
MINLLTQRQDNILHQIIHNYTNLGKPIGSKTLMEEGIAASSATIRNEMKTLEEYGLLVKPHSSSGRIPSLKGYRYYVDYLLEPEKLKKSEVDVIQQSLGKDFHEINDIIEQSAKILSKLTSYTALSIGPDVSNRKLTGFKMVPLNNRQVIAIIVTDKGNVENQVFSIPKSVDSEDLEKMVRIINDKLIGEPLLIVYQRLRTEIPMILHKYFQTTEGILDLFNNMLSEAFEEKIFVGGQMNLLNSDQIQDIDQFKSMYLFMENSKQLNELLSTKDQPIQIRIGSELGNDLLSDMSLIQANYEIKDHGNGTIALLGSASMPYSKMLSLLDVFRQELAETLDDYYRSIDSFG